MKTKITQFIILALVFIYLEGIQNSAAQVQLLEQKQISDKALFFNGSLVSNVGDGSTSGAYDYRFGKALVADGDCITTYQNFVFMGWWRGDRDDRKLILSRYNKTTGVIKEIIFNRQHTGYLGDTDIGESHNTVAVGISPKDGTIHMLYDMHAYSNTRPTNGSFSNDYFRYSYSIPNGASVSDANFTLANVFVPDNYIGAADALDYTHLDLNGSVDYNQFSALTYPIFFLDDDGGLFFHMRVGGNNNGAYYFWKYDGNGTWGTQTQLNTLNARNFSGVQYNWGLYGDIKFLGGKITVGFQQRSANNSDRYLYQNGLYYGYSNESDGKSGWKNYKDENVTIPLRTPDPLFVYEPGDQVTTTRANKVRMTGPFDYTVTDRGDIHMIARVKDDENNAIVYVHSYKPFNQSTFIHSSLQSAAETLYTYNNNVYTIGLVGGKITVNKAEGGTNSFSRVFTQSTSDSKSFRHGRVHIANGKVYYFLMQNAGLSNSYQPIHLYIIDLAQDTNQDNITYRFKNVGTNRYMGSDQNLVLTYDTSQGANKEWEFIKSGFGEFYNIDSKNDTGTGNGILRGVNSNNSVISTNFMAPDTASDKQWSYTLQGDGSYLIELGTTGKYLENTAANEVKLTTAANNATSKWMLEDTTLSNEDNLRIDQQSISVYPNPARGRFNISLQGFQKATIIISDMLGKTVHTTSTENSIVEISNSHKFTSGLFLIKVIAEDSKVYYKKLIIK